MRARESVRVLSVHFVLSCLALPPYNLVAASHFYRGPQSKLHNYLSSFPSSSVLVSPTTRVSPPGSV